MKNLQTINTPLAVATQISAMRACVQEHCANRCTGCTCAGIDFRPDGSMFGFRPSGSRCLIEHAQRCSYFETAVLPMRDRKLWPNDYGVTLKRFMAGADTYSRLHGLEQAAPTAALSDRKCPDCGKRSVDTRKRYCAECRFRRRKATNAANQRNWQEKQAHPNTVNGNGSSLGAASQATDSVVRYPLSGRPEVIQL